MKLFLIIVGAVLTAFILCLLILRLCLRWLTRNVRGAMKQLGDVLEKVRPKVPPLRIKLRPVEAIHWQRPDDIEALVEPLRQARFTEIGTFRTDGSGVALEALWRPDDSVYAIVYEHPKAGVWLDLVTRFQDGSRITYCTQRDTLLDHAEHNVVRFHEGMPAGELLSRFLAERPSKPIASMSPEEFVGHFEQAYADTMDWIIARGGPTEAEIRRQCERRGDTDESSVPVLVTAIRESWAVAIDTFYQDQLKERYQADEQPSAARWQEIRDRLVFVHDRLTPERLEALCEQEMADDDPAAFTALPDGSASPRDGFARWNATLAVERRYEKIGELSEPLAADVYLSPES
jgi:hypothetical protein